MYHHAPELINNYGQEYSVNGLSFDLGYKRNVAEFNAENPSDVLDIPIATGCSLSVRWDIVRKLTSEGNGWELWDDSYFLYGEDTDLSMRIRGLGYRCVLAKRSVVRHKVSISTKKMGDLSLYHFYKNLSQTYLKNLSWRELLKYSPTLLAMEAASFPYTVIRGKARIWLRAKWWVLKNFRTILRKREAVQKMKVSSMSDEFVNRWKPNA